MSSVMHMEEYHEYASLQNPVHCMNSGYQDHVFSSPHLVMLPFESLVTRLGSKVELVVELCQYQLPVADVGINNISVVRDVQQQKPHATEKWSLQL